MIYGGQVTPPPDQPLFTVVWGSATRGVLWEMEIWPKDNAEPVESIRQTFEQTGGELVEEPEVGIKLADLLNKLRQRYLIYFYAGKPSGREESRTVAVRLSPDAQRSYPGAIVRGQKTYRVPALAAN